MGKLRNFSPQRMFCALAEEHRPECEFDGGDFTAWKTRTLPRVKACLGDWPERVPLNAELSAEWEHDGLCKQRWLIDVSKHISAACLVNRPAGAATGEKLPAILCCHGHGPFGKEPVMGNDSHPDLRRDIAQMNYDYGHQMAKKGFVTFAIDWIGFGERNDRRKPNLYVIAEDRDPCDIYYLHATMLGMTSLSINITHGKAAIDFACGLPFVDPERLGVMGLSGGGTMSLWMYLCDERLKAAEIICYSDLWQCFGIRDMNYCGMQVAPGLYKLVDLPDLQGLLAPRPLLVDIGVYDGCFMIDSAMACCRRLQKIYAAAGAPERLQVDLHARAHAWGAGKSEAFFREWLR